MSILSKNTTIGGHKPLLNDTALQALVTSLGLGETTDEGVLAAAISAIANKKATDISLGTIKLSTGNSSNNASDSGEAVAYKVINQTTINLNNFITEGNYTIITPSTANCSNFPTSYTSLSSSYGWHLTVWRMYTNNWVMQIITREQQDGIFMRYKNSSTWSSWVKIYHSANHTGVNATTVEGKKGFTSLGSTFTTNRAFNTTGVYYGIAICNSSTNAPTSSCSWWGYMQLPTGNTSGFIQFAWPCDNHATTGLYRRYYRGSSGFTSWQLI